jgi:hypothetical protein
MSRRAVASIAAAPARPAARVDVDRINVVNIGLMIASAVLACTMPFEVFLLSYAILGPLHYLTQISWLHDREYFATNRLDWVPLVLLGLTWFDAMYTHRLGWDGAPVAAAGFGVVAAFVRHPIVKLSALVVGVALSLPLLDWLPGRLFFGVLLTTVIHVYVFTGLFILAGSMKSRSRTGYLSFCVFLACGIGLLVIQPSTTYEPSAWARTNLGPFSGIVTTTSRLVPEAAAAHGAGRDRRFLAFAPHTYHYLNWFSRRASSAGNEIGAGTHGGDRRALVCLARALRVRLTRLDSRRSSSLSVTHVFLEFPLDARTAIDVVTGPRSRPRGRDVPARAARAA